MMRATPRPLLPRWRQTLCLLALMALSGATACAEAPDARLAEARVAAEAKDLDAFLLFFTPASAEVLRGAHDAAERSRGRLGYVKSVFEVLPPGEITEVTIRGNLALVDVADKNRKATIRMLKDKGHWVIDALALDGFWAPLHHREVL